MEPITQEDVFLILKLIEESKYDELHLEMGELKLDVKKRGNKASVADSNFVPEQTSKPVLSPKSPERQKKEKHTSVTTDVTTDESSLVPIKASMLGTFYRASKPGAPPFVKEGQKINADDTVCIIEVMKLFNTVKAGVSGRIASICAKDGEMVEYQQTLFLVEEADAPGKGKRKSA
ncbi:MAG: acetyl-CoA carboxylase biotin carboxyl carrier protein [Deltaproteobacteria bacterium]|nr:acetyl-CoA carboxylase biotin carboxyl carrier protein [Deltaproteobacteria bacterium]